MTEQKSPKQDKLSSQYIIPDSPKRKEAEAFYQRTKEASDFLALLSRERELEVQLLEVQKKLKEMMSKTPELSQIRGIVTQKKARKPSDKVRSPQQSVDLPTPFIVHPREMSPMQSPVYSQSESSSTTDPVICHDHVIDKGQLHASED